MDILRLVIDSIFGAALFINAMLFLPQALRIYRSKHAADISLITFAGFILINLSAVAYGWLNNDYFLVIGYSLSILTCGLVVVLALYYRK